MFRILLRCGSVALALSLAIFGCGGSSSETPPPLEPLPVNLHYDRASTALADEVPVVEADAGTVARTDEEPSESDGAVPPARSTWGGDSSPAARPSLK